MLRVLLIKTLDLIRNGCSENTNLVIKKATEGNLMSYLVEKYPDNYNVDILQLSELYSKFDWSELEGYEETEGLYMIIEAGLYELNK